MGLEYLSMEQDAFSNSRNQAWIPSNLNNPHHSMNSNIQVVAEETKRKDEDVATVGAEKEDADMDTKAVEPCLQIISGLCMQQEVEVE